MDRRSFLGKAFAGVAGMAAATFGLLAGKREPEPRIYKDDQSELTSKQWMLADRRPGWVFENGQWIPRLGNSPTLVPGWTKDQEHDWFTPRVSDKEATKAFSDVMEEVAKRTGPFPGEIYYKPSRRWTQITINTASKEQYPDVDLSHPPVAYAAKHNWTWADLWNYVGKTRGKRNA